MEYVFKKAWIDGDVLGPFKRIMITGGAGFIGSHLVDRVLQEGVGVVVIDDLSTGRRTNIEPHLRNRNFTFIRGDIRDGDMVNTALEDVDAVLHQAALVSVNRSVENPVATNEVNVGGTVTVLKACLDHDVKRLIFASSSSVYGDTEILPKREEMGLNPISPYAVSKMAAEHYVRVFHKVYGLETICLRYFNVYGPRQTVGPYSGVIPIFLDALLHDRRPVVYGDGEQTRDFTNVRDVVEANVRALLSDRAVGEAVNVSTGNPSTINDLASTLQAITGKTALTPLHTDPRPGDVKHSYADIGKARELLGYHPQVSLHAGLTELVKYWKTQIPSQ